MIPTEIKLESVPTNIVTGFLGVGKTSAILNLLKNKPEQERWAVLVNEFGEIGVDGSLFEGQHSRDTGVFISEVPGGCMCCAAGLPMQIALVDLLRKAQPDRLLIEPTGLGHPKEVLQALNDVHFKGILDIQKTITLVDARKLADERYTRHETFNQQIAIADVIIGNKTDLCEAEDKIRLSEYVFAHSLVKPKIVFSEFGVFDATLLVGATALFTVQDDAHHHHHSDTSPLASELEFPENGVIKASNAGEGYISVGWRFHPDKVFDYKRVCRFVIETKAERLKAVFITDYGIFSYNKTLDSFQEKAVDKAAESRIEIIAEQESGQWQDDLYECLKNMS